MEFAVVCGEAACGGELAAQCFKTLTHQIGRFVADAGKAAESGFHVFGQEHAQPRFGIADFGCIGSRFMPFGHNAVGRVEAGKQVV